MTSNSGKNLRKSRRKFGECTRKVSYDGPRSAKAALKRMNDKGLHIYHCRYYDHWHLGHIKPYIDSR